MPVIEWIFLVYYVLGICSGLYFITQGGFHSSRSETLGAVIISLSLTLGLWFSMPLTWFGAFLMIYEALFACIYAVRYATRPNGTTYNTTSIVVSLVIAVVGLILFLTVGIVV